MTIYIPQHFAGDDATGRRLIAEFPFATLVTSARDAEPHVTYIPMQLEGDVLLGHIARANPHWRHFGDGPTVALFHGPHAFVSPHWYERPADNVPTWNYAVVHAHGRPEPLEGEGLRAHLERLAGHFDHGRPLPTEPERVERLLPGIVPFRMPIGRLEVKLKMSQNKTPADRRGVIAGLRATGRADSLAVAQWMEAHEPR